MFPNYCYVLCYIQSQALEKRAFLVAQMMNLPAV